MPEMLFRNILHAHDGSDSASAAFNSALAIASLAGGELHIVSVGEIDHIPQFVKDIREQKRIAAQRLRGFVFRARSMAASPNVTLHGHVLVGQPVWAIVRLAQELDAVLLAIGARGHSALYERLVGSRAAQTMQLEHCPVLAVKSADRRSRAKRKFRLRLTRAWDELARASEPSEQVALLGSQPSMKPL